MGNTYRRQQILENLIYAAIWLILFVAPLLDYVYKQNASVDWNDIFHSWKMMIPFFLIFLINNFLLMPQLLIKKKSWLYLLTTLVTICFLISFTPHIYRVKGPNFDPRFNSEWKRPIPYHLDKNTQPPFPRPMPENNKHEFSIPPRNEFLHVHFMQPFLNNFIIAVLMVGFNIAVKLLFQSIRDEHQLKELEKHNLQTELAYLKHQINPHFFMNTLNNIHALIDIDFEKAKETVLELSKMMRYVLYDSSQATISLEKEIQFINNYIDLMKLRYTDKVSINLLLPDIVPVVQVPPLLFISFLENAFKHGISYQQESYINFSLEVNEKDLKCLISNSNCGNPSEIEGIGLDNVRKRLNLLYPDNYTLKIDSSEKEYSVLLILPLI